MHVLQTIVFDDHDCGSPRTKDVEQLLGTVAHLAPENEQGALGVLRKIKGRMPVGVEELLAGVRHVRTLADVYCTQIEHLRLEMADFPQSRRAYLGLISQLEQARSWVLAMCDRIEDAVAGVI